MECARIGRFEEAEPLLARAIELAPGIEAPKYLALAEIQMELGRLGQTETLLRQALEIDDGNSRARTLLGQIEASQPPEHVGSGP